MCNLFQAKFTLFLCCLVQLTRLSQAAEGCPGSATYRLTFNAEWSSTTHPKAFVPSAHFSPMVVCTHNSSYVMWKPGQMATPGVKLVAEIGATGTINREIDEQIRRKAASARFQGSVIRPSPGDDKINDIQVSTKYPLISAITMIAPSPDWFVGIHDVNFCNKTTGKWLDKYEKDLFPYDAGTDSGLTFVSGDIVTNPQEVIALIKNTEEGSFKSNDPIKRLGTFILLKTSESIPNLQSSRIVSPDIQATATISPDIQATATVSPGIQATATVSPDIQATATVSPYLQPTTAQSAMTSMAHGGTLTLAVTTHGMTSPSTMVTTNRSLEGISQTSASVLNRVITPTKNNTRESTTNDAVSSVYASLSSTLLKFTMSFCLSIVIHAS